ncbi:MAG TPA: hypothetical protein VKT82_08975 [Ktedonobacterales bacterium]|nr:hypothetical protein [Ktedonobacterales bacterium]
MIQASGQLKVSPRALTGKILTINGVVFIVLGLLLAAYFLFSLSGTASPQERALLLVTGILSLVFCGIGTPLVLVGLLLWRLPGESPTASVVSGYLAAFENQDYMTAYSYLNPDMKTPQGQPITSAWFVQRAQAYDMEQGRVTNYGLAAVRANPGRRRFTIKVTRGNSVYKTNLFLRQQGGEWRITGFDRF